MTECPLAGRERSYEVEQDERGSFMQHVVTMTSHSKSLLVVAGWSSPSSSCALDRV